MREIKQGVPLFPKPLSPTKVHPESINTVVSSINRRIRIFYNTRDYTFRIYL